ncbi:non-hydrolyzing UDP-N-acetylglucosamine 2-epimerase [Enterococcus hirae]
MQKKIKVLTIFGTRPEAIKMAPLVKKLENDQRFISKVAITAQHREMLDQVLDVFEISPDYDLNLMKTEQSLVDITTKILIELTPILKRELPDFILVHGDTVTTFGSSLAAFYQKIRIAHVEAGLRTWDKYSPFPEEMNRQMTDILADIFFAPTEKSKENLEKENHLKKKIFVTGNTAIDAMQYTIKKDFQHKLLQKKLENKKIILLTMHRRENLGKPMINVFQAVARIAKLYPNVYIIFPMHPNPKVRKDAQAILANIKNVDLIEPLEVVDFHNVMARSYCILTDSGGVQEEAPSLGIPVLVLRNTTERPEGVQAGTLKLVGTSEDTVFKEIECLIKDKNYYDTMSKSSNPYGDGKACNRIIEALANYKD